MSLLYHYASNQKAFGILQSRSIRLSDIRKSNDYNELLIFYPDIFDEILRVYMEEPFSFRLKEKKDEAAIKELLTFSCKMLKYSIDDGSFTNFVLCFSQEADMLSQWRGYANDGQGLSLGFSKKNLEKLCGEMDSIFALKKVTYITENDQQQILSDIAKAVCNELKGLREWIVEYMTFDDSSDDTDRLLEFNFHGLIENYMLDSLQYKMDGFKEEKEWRLYLKNHVYKNPEWVVYNHNGVDRLDSTINFLNNRIEFNISDNNISPYVPLHFSEVGKDFLKEIWVGPKSQVVEKDLELYLAQHEYKDVKIKFSKTSYR